MERILCQVDGSKAMPHYIKVLYEANGLCGKEKMGIFGDVCVDTNNC